MVNFGLLIGFVLILIFIIVILLIALPPLVKFAFQEEQQKSFEDLNRGHMLMCGTSDEFSVIFDAIDVISSDNFDNKAKGIYQQMQWGKDIKSCDIVYFYNQLNTEQKERLNWLELSCDVRKCLND